MRDARLGKSLLPAAERQKRRIAWTGAGNPMKRPEVAAKISAATKGIKRTPETRARIAASATARWTTPEMLAMMRGPDNPARRPGVRAKISAAMAGVQRKPAAPCGTLAGYSRARDRKVKGLDHCGPCVLCRRAAADYAARRRLAR